MTCGNNRCCNTCVKRRCGSCATGATGATGVSSTAFRFSGVPTEQPQPLPLIRLTADIIPPIGFVLLGDGGYIVSQNGNYEIGAQLTYQVLQSETPLGPNPTVELHITNALVISPQYEIVTTQSIPPGANANVDFINTIYAIATIPLTAGSRIFLFFKNNTAATIVPNISDPGANLTITNLFGHSV